jgi:hypothetical protein
MNRRFPTALAAFILAAAIIIALRWAQDRNPAPDNGPVVNQPQELLTLMLSRFRNRNERTTRPHDDRLRQFHPAAFTHRRCRQKTEPLAGAGVNLEHRNLPTDLNSFQMKTGNNPVVGEPEGKAGVFIQRQHQRSLFNPRPA